MTVGIYYEDDARQERFAWVIDRDFRWVALSDDFASLYGYRPAELIGRSAWETVPATVEHRREVEQDMLANGHRSSVIARMGRIPIAYSARAVNGGEFYVVTGEPLDQIRPRSSHPERDLRQGFTLAHELTIDGWLTKPEAAEYARCSVATIERAVHDEKLRAGGTGGQRLFRRAWLDAWLGAAILILVAAVLGLLLLFGVFSDPDQLGVSHHRDASVATRAN